MTRFPRAFAGLLLLGLLTSCGKTPWNDPYPTAERGQNTLYSVFSERPKHLDPARSYSSNEVVFTGQIYEPPLQYHYLKRPYELEPLTVREIPQARYFDAQGKLLAQDVEAAQVAVSEYEIRILPGIRYQPHPAFAQDAQGRFLYHALSPAQLEKIVNLSDFKSSATRELIADEIGRAHV